MASPIPPVTIGSGSCSTIYNNTLYVYSANAFQKLPLHLNATWSSLANGVGVSQAVCVLGKNADGGDSLWVVGGQANQTVADYVGLQQYSFSNNTWATVAPVVQVTKNRIDHAAVYLPEASSLLVYSGSQIMPVVPSSQTFMISIFPPYLTQSFVTRDHPSTSPLLLNWNNDSAITLGGTDDETSIFRFDPVNGWRNISTSLPKPIGSAGDVRANLIQGSDNSKVLEIFELSSTPIAVSQLVLQYADGALAPENTTLSSQKSSSTQKRDLSLANWPTYNSTYAPTTARSGYSLSSGADGLTAFSGGDAQNPVLLFDQNTNSWLDTGAFFGVAAPSVVSGILPASSTSSPTTSSSAAATSSAAAAPVTTSNHHRTALILGATLGTIFGLIALLLILLLLLRWRRKRKADAEKEEKDGGRLSFADRGDPDMAEAGGAVSHNHNNEKLVAPVLLPAVDTRARSGTLRSESSRTALISPNRDQFMTHPEMSPLPDMQRTFAPYGTHGPHGGLAVPPAIAEVDSRPNSAFLQLPAAPASRGSNGSGWSNYFTNNTKPEVVAVPAAAVVAPINFNQTPRNSVLAPLPDALPRQRRDTLLDYDEMKPDEDELETSPNGPIPPVSLAPEWKASRVSQELLGREAENTTGVAQVVRGLRPGTSSRNGHTRNISSIGSTNNGSVFTHDPMADDTQWTPVTRNDWSTPRGRNTVASSLYGGAEEPKSDGTDPDDAVPSPSLRPGGKTGQSAAWTGMASPRMPFEEVLGQDSPTPKARIMSAEKATPMPVAMGKWDKPQYGSVEGSPAMTGSAFGPKRPAMDSLDWVKLEKS